MKIKQVDPKLQKLQELPEMQERQEPRLPDDRGGAQQLIRDIRGLDPTDRAAGTKAAKMVKEAAQGMELPKGMTPAAFRAQLFEAALPKLDKNAGHVQVAQTLLNDAVQLEAQEAVRFQEVFGDQDLSQHQVNSQNVLEGLSGLASGGKTLGAQDSHDGWYRTGVDWIVRTSQQEGTLTNNELKQMQVTQYDGVAGRNTGAPFTVLQQESSAAETPMGKADYRQALEKARNGLDSALQATAYTVQNGLVQTKDFEAAVDEGVKSPFEGAKQRMMLTPDQKTDLQALGQQLWQVVQDFDAKGDAFKWEDHGNASDFAKNGQFFWANRDLGRDMNKAALRDGVKEFDNLSTEQQVQNLRSMVAGVGGCLRADQLNQEVLQSGSHDSLQMMLDFASQAALGERRVKEGRKVHAEAIADEIAPQMGYLMGLGTRFGNDNLVAIRNAVADAVQVSGYKLAFEGAGAASKVAVEMAGEFMVRAFPNRFDSADQAKEYAKEIFLNAGYGACRKFAENLGHDTKDLGATQEIRASILEDKKDNWGIDGLKKISGEDKAFTNEQQSDFQLLMTLFNATWITQQEGRARVDEKAGNDDNRVQAEQRDVYQPYLALLRGVDGKESIFRIAQDLMEAQKKSEA